MDTLQRFQQIFEQVLSFESLSEDDAEFLIELIFDAKLSPAQTGAILTALRMKKETAPEIKAFASIMRKKCNRVETHLPEVTDVVGTGGDSSGSINISTTSALVCATAGIPVAKHGNRSITSLSGSADVMEQCKVNIFLNPKQALKCLKKTNFVFLFAPLFHPSIKNGLQVRRELKIRTLFNMLGPLANPALANIMLLGVYSREYLKLYSDVLISLKIKSAYVVSSFDGLDEVSLSDNTEVICIRNGKATPMIFRPEEYGFKKQNKKDILGSTPEKNAKLVKKVLSGKDMSAITDIIVLNSGFAISAARQISLEDGFAEAESVIKSGNGLDKLEQIVQVSSTI